MSFGRCEICMQNFAFCFRTREEQVANFVGAPTTIR